MRRLISLAVVVLSLAMVLPPGLLVVAEGPSLAGLTVDGSPLIAGEGQRIEVTVTLAQEAELRLRVVDFDGRTVRELFAGPGGAGSLTRAWYGRDSRAERVPAGPYRLVATATSAGATERAQAWVTLADRAVYPTRPEFITIAVDPGHGGELSGAVGRDGTREADINLDIGLRLARMLEGAGVGVVLTRSADVFVNEPPEERTGDGVIDGDDELAARPDLANLARADLFLSIHNNNAVNKSTGGPSTLYYDERPFGARSVRLARIVQDEMLAALGGISDGYEPYDHGTLIYPYYVLRGYDPPRLRRPTQMPGVLSEGMFLSNERELRYLKRPAVRARMAVAYYDAIARYLERRTTHAGYQLVKAPDAAAASGEAVPYLVEVRNGGNETMRDWRLQASAYPAPSRYIGRIRRDTSSGEARIPRLEPGESAIVENRSHCAGARRGLDGALRRP